MQRFSLLAVIFAGVIALPVSRAATTTPRLHNDQVDVTETTLAPGESLSLAGHHPSVVVYLTGSAASLDANKKPVHRGESVFVPADVHSIANAGRNPLRFVCVELLTLGSSEVWGSAGLPPNYNVLFENRYARVYDIRIPAQSKEQRHTHHARVVVCLSGAKLEHILADGHTQPSTLNTGDVVWRLGQTHVGHNIGDTNLWAISIEPKQRSDASCSFNPAHGRSSSLSAQRWQSRSVQSRASPQNRSNPCSMS